MILGVNYVELKTLDQETLMSINSIEPSGNNILIEGHIMGALPVRAVLTPKEARAALRLLSVRKVLFLLTFIFRTG